MEMDSPVRRIRELVEKSSPRDFPSPASIDKYVQLLDEMYELGLVYEREGKDERAFVLLLRFIG